MATLERYCCCWWWRRVASLALLCISGQQGAHAAWIPSPGNGVVVVRRRDSVAAPIPFTSSQRCHVAKTKWENSRSIKKLCLITKSSSANNNNDAVADTFVDEINEKNAVEITAEVASRVVGKDLDGLKRLFRGMEGTISNRDKKDSETISELISAGEFLIRGLERMQAIAKKNAINRVASITVGLEESLKHDVDLREFQRRVLDLFNWYNGDQSNTYMAPYMPLIQSSGTGKTRIFMALREVAKASNNEEVDYDCMTVLCLPSDNVATVVENSDVYFDHTIRLNRWPDDPGLQRQLIKTELQALLSKSTKDKLVLLFDEAQHLLRDRDDAADFRCIRWWLREARRTKQVVAVFAGTTPKLANVYYEAAPPMGFSRDAVVKYVNWKDKSGPISKMYDPFYRICTMGCFQKDAPLDNNDLALLSDFERAAYYGRPLFAYLQKTKQLIGENNNDAWEVKNRIEIINPTLHGILKRMLMLSDTRNWEGNTAAVCSILGSRVQMGVTTSFGISSDLVSKGYAHLVHYHPDASKDRSSNNAVTRVSFMPDPVCAALAMGLMNDKWTMQSSGEDEDDRITGEGKWFWSRQAMVLLASGLCLPVKSDPVEIMAALYMLFCGDVLRYAKDKTLRTFSVPLTDWFSKMKGTTKEAISSDKASCGDISMDVNFIQVCRNYFRAHSWTTHNGLELMYKSAVASYVHPDCKAVDVAAAIRVMRDGRTSYHPLLVSVKRYNKMSLSEIKKAVQDMQDLLREIRSGEIKKWKGPIAEIASVQKIRSLLKGDMDDTSVQQVEDLLDDIENGISPREQLMNTMSTTEVKNDDPNFEKCPPALCLLVLIGAQEQPNLRTEQNAGGPNVEVPTDAKGERQKAKVVAEQIFTNELDSLELGNFPEEDVYRMITVPADDPFDISEAVRDMTSVHEMSEIFASHGFIYGEDQHVESRDQVLRAEKQRKTQPDEAAKFVDSLLTLLD